MYLDQLFSAKSSIHGTGVFTRSYIPAGKHIGTFEGTLLIKNDRYVISIRDEQTGKIYYLEGTGLLKYINHHPNPNTELRGKEVYAIQNIQVNEELTLFYGKRFNDLYHVNPYRRFLNRFLYKFRAYLAAIARRVFFFSRKTTANK